MDPLSGIELQTSASIAAVIQEQTMVMSHDDQIAGAPPASMPTE